MNTFLVVTFAWSLAFALWWICRLARCRHAWELIDKTEMPAPILSLQKVALKEVSCFKEDTPRLLSMTVVLALRCSKCGAAKIHKIAQN